MADERIVAQDTFEQSIKDILTVLVNSTYDWQEYTDTEISDILEITDEQAMQLTKILNDQVVANNKLWSSSKTDAEIKNALIESNKYADELIGKISSISLEYVTTLPTSDIKSNVIYILQGTPNTLNVFNESTSSFVSVGDLNLELSGYYTSTEVDNLLADKADDNTVVHADAIVADLTTTSGSTTLSTAGLQTELDKKVDKSAILSAVSATPSDEKVISEKATKAELDKKIDKTSIATSIDSSSTDTQVASAKCINDNYGIKTFTKLEQLGLTEGSETLEGIIGAMPEQSVFSYTVTANSNTSIYPKQDGMLIINKQGDWRVNLTFYSDSISEQWIGYYQKSSGMQAFRKVCTTDLQNKSFNTLTTETTANYTLDLVRGTVLNGICTVTVAIKVVAPTTSFVEVASGLPKLNNPFYVPPLYNWSDGANTNTSAPLHIVVSDEGKIRCELGVANKVYYVTITYQTLQ